jgi:hypothetical protein
MALAMACASSPTAWNQPRMPESPDFEHIARLVAMAIPSIVTRELVEQDIAEQLRQVWNARGAADLEKVESELSTMMGSTAAGLYVKHLDRALRTLDRR